MRTEIKLHIPPMVWRDIMQVTKAYTTEIGLEGVIEQVDGANYRLTRVDVFPQIVSGAFVESDNDRYPVWKVTNYTPQEMKKVRCWIHSHPGSVQPSGHDTTNFMNRDLNAVDDYFIMLIVNKKGDKYCKIGIHHMGAIYYFDMKVNIEMEYNEVLAQQCKEMIKDKPVVKPIKTYTGKGKKNKYPSYYHQAAARYQGYGAYLYDMDEEEEQAFLEQMELEEDMN